MKFKVFIISIAMCLMMCTLSFADAWVKDGQFKKYQVGDKFATSTWQLIKEGDNYNNYYFDEEGHMVTGVWKIGNEYYSFKNNGAANSKSKVTIDGEQFETANKGLIENYPQSCAQDTFKGIWIENKYYANGAPIVSNWRLINNNKGLAWYYFDANGEKVTGFQQLPDNNFYYFDADGAAVSHSTGVQIYDFEEKCETTSKGQVLSLPNGFNKEKYEAELKAKKESLAIEQSIEAANNAAFHAQTTLSAEELARIEASKQARIAEAEADRAQKAAAQVSMVNKVDATLQVLGDENGKINVKYVVPVVAGANADALNATIATQLKDIIYGDIEDKYGDTTKLMKVNITDVSMYQNIENNILTFNFYGDEGYHLLVYLDTSNMQMYTQ